MVQSLGQTSESSCCSFRAPIRGRLLHNQTREGHARISWVARPNVVSMMQLTDDHGRIASCEAQALHTCAGQGTVRLNCREVTHRDSSLATGGVTGSGSAPVSAALVVVLPRAASSPSRSFHTTPAALKKSKAKKMVEQQENNPSSSPSSSSSSRNSASTSTSDHDDDADAARNPKPDAADPLNTDDLTSRWAALDTHFRDALRRLATGGRFQPRLDRRPARGPRPQSPPSASRCAKFAQASPDFNQQPQPSPDNDLELLLKVEPERKEDLVVKAKALTPRLAREGTPCERPQEEGRRQVGHAEGDWARPAQEGRC
ncbi:conserved hypothetical protein [Verticillium alfalfae VaMs.102]|uniref:Uncharacterized protein n=1 Tax=Verticillium alfalfae (strain VaMs.102 / ATCC MYA-4576 / FGSC 10136) TaxID=526221 RepID=C9SQI4_VERA1|nr:conserved hypothetical protein [Verticillium alfalfae VaMs.102]EEY21109.1 conserved hypothetical protein [Verticillium alfalfae VaMs.102]